MSYKNEKFYLAQNTDNPSLQTISTSYQEITGSKCNIAFKKNTANVLYKFCFFSTQKYVSANNYDKTLIHVKLQKSNDNFSSNAVDIPGKQFNFSGDTQQSEDFFYMSCQSFFIIENLDSKYLRLVARAYSTSHETDLHRNEYWDGGVNEVYFNPSLIVTEI